ncbi:hypothetical protein V1512DRAFT_250751 [Lipomyces arxii]|uniref:uncharacterized protein n=1 Tax=Lipomyces arxii TaxID=56418 RepID=UPI0034CEEE1F
MDDDIQESGLIKAMVPLLDDDAFAISDQHSPLVDDARTRPRTYPYAALLPFTTEDQSDRIKHLNHITENLYVALSSESLAIAPLLHWTRELRSWLQLKFDMPVSTRTKLAAIYYEIALAQGMPISASDRFASTFVVLAQKRSLLDPTQLTLDWKLLFREFKKIAFPHSLSHGTRSYEKEPETLSKIGLVAKRFFPPESQTELLEELLPFYNTVRQSSAHQVLSILDALLPFDAIPENHAHLYPQSWLPSLFHIWSLFTRSQQYDLEVMDILSRLSLATVRQAHIPFSSFGIFTKEQTAVMFTCALRLVEVPVGRAGSPYLNSFDLSSPMTKSDSKRSRCARPIARWIVASLSPESLVNPDSVLRGLQGLLQAVETFFHPSNSGTWTKNLTQLVQSLADMFVLRWNQEQSGEIEVDERRRLTPELKREFVLTLKDAVFMGIHSKSSTAASHSQAALQCLAILEPDIVLPLVLRQSYPSLQGLVETHRTITSFKTLTLLSQTLIRHKPSRLHVTTLLGLALPGIDANDLSKTVQTFAFIQSIAAYVPFVDLSEGSGPGLAMEYITNSISLLEEGEDVSQMVALSEEDEIAVLKSSTASFGEFMTSFMDRVFSLLENLPDAGTRSRATPEQSVVNMIPTAFNVILGSLSDDLFDLVLDKFADFVTDHVIPQSTDAMANLMSCLSLAKPERTFNKLFTVLDGNIREEIDENHAGMSKSSETVPKDRALVWYLSLFRKSVWTSGRVLTKHRAQIADLIFYLRQKCRGATSAHTSNLMHHTMYALTNIYTADCRLVSGAELKMRSYNVSDWGRQLDPQNDSLDIEWHIPNEDEVEFAVDLFEKNVEYSIAVMTRLMEDGNKSNKDWSEEMTRELSYLRLLVSGSAILYDPKVISSAEAPVVVAEEHDGDIEMADDSDADGAKGPSIGDIQFREDIAIDEEDEGDDEGNGDDEEMTSIKKTFTYPTGYHFTNQNSELFNKMHELHNRIGVTLHSVHEYLAAKHEDDVHSFVSLCSVYRVWFIDVGCERSIRLLDTLIRSYLSDVRIYKVSGLRKQYPRYLMSRRAAIYHLQRIKHNNGMRDMSALDKVLLADLVQDSVSQYADTRHQAQHSLEATIKVLIGSRFFVASRAIKELNTAIKDTNYDRAKGAMRVLDIRSIFRFASKDCRIYNSMAMALLNAAKVDKPEIYDLSRSILLSFVVVVRLLPKTAYYSNNFELALSQIRPETDYTQRIKDSSAKGDKVWNERCEALKKFEADLVLQYKEEQHWRMMFLIATLLMSSLSVLTPTFSPEVGEIFFKGSIDSHPHLRFLLVQSALRLTNLCYIRAQCGNDTRRLIQSDYYDMDTITVTVDRDDPHFTDKFLASLNDPESPYYQVQKDRPGWLVWGKSFLAESRIPGTHAPVFSEDDDHVLMQSALQVDLKWFNKLCDNMMQEPRIEQDAFRAVYSTFSMTVFTLMASGRTTLTWEEATTKIMEMYGDGKDRNHHRAVAELLAGMLSNSTSLEYREKANTFVVKLLSSVIDDELTPENLPYWTGFVGYLSNSVDPRSIWPLVQKLTSVRIDATSNAAFKESSRIALMRAFLSRASWSFQMYQPIMDDLLNNLDHSYKGVREEIGRTLSLFPKSHYYESFKDIATLLQANYEAGPLGLIAYPMTDQRTEMIEKVFARLAQWRSERQPLQETSSYTNGSKTVMIWFEFWLSTPACTALIPFFPKLILPELLNLLDIKEDSEVTPLAVSIFKHFGNLPCPPHLLQQIISGIADIASTSNTWHQRLRVLAVVQVFYFRQLFQLSNASRRSMFDCVFRLLSDPQLEVRDTAATTLSGMIRCSPTAFRNTIVIKLQKQFTKMLQDNRLPGRSRSASSVKLDVELRSPSNSEYNVAILNRHAAVLGLSALVQAFPYQSPPPKWIPDVLTTLAKKAANDPGMVGRSVKTALGEFKKTRQDTWHVDSKVFETEQLEDLEGVLWRSYFA